MGRLAFRLTISRGEEIGWLVATGATIEDVADAMKEKVKLLPDGVSAATDSLYDLVKSIHEGEKEGIEFGKDTIPSRKPCWNNVDNGRHLSVEWLP